MYQRKQINVYQDNVYKYTTDDDISNRPWHGTTWAPDYHIREDEICAAIVWDKPHGKTSRWSIKLLV